MVPVMVCLMAAGSIRGFAEALALVLAEVSVGAGVAVAAEAGEFGSRFKLALTRHRRVKLQKGWILCQEEMVQDRAARGVVPGEVWGEVLEAVEAGWAAHLPQGRVEIASARNAARRCHTL